MSSTAMIPALQVVIPEGTVIGPATMLLLSSGLVGMSIKNMFDSILSDEAEDDGATGGGGGDELTDGGGLMAAEDDGDEFGDLGGLDDDGGDMGGFGDDEFGQMDDAAAGADTDELEHRLDELENEVGSLSSTVNTVRTENEQISESVDEVEENVRKLLDIYEMVTRGVNPFADDIEAGMAGGDVGGETSFGLFDNGEDEDDQEGDEIDEGIATADAEGFFDEDLVDDDDDDDEVLDGDDGGFEDDGGSFDDDLDGGDLDDGGDGGDGGKSFQELKSEYDSGDAEWADGQAAEEEADDTDLEDELEGDELFEDDGFDEVDEDGFDEFEDDGETVDDAPDDGVEEPAVVEESADPEPTETSEEPAQQPTEPASTQSTATEQTAETGGDAAPTPDAAATSGGRTPYLASIPSTFACDLIVVEWLEFLLQQAGHREAARAIDYYETIDWIAEDVAEDLHEVLRGFDDGSGSEGGLTIDHHTRSLRYISQLDEDSGEAAALSKLVGGGADGIQR